MILVDSSVWVDYFSGSLSPQTEQLDHLLGSRPLAIGDLILAEVLQGFSRDQDFERASKLLTSLTVLTLGGEQIAMQASRNFRILRRLGITVRKTIDSIIATSCIENDLKLLHNDKDFEPFVKYLGLSSVF